MASVRLFNIWHERLFPELLEEVPLEERKHIVLYGVNEKYNKEPIPVEGYEVVYEYDLPKYESKWQDRNYCQSSCLYHVYKHPELYEGYDYIGFGQYDMKYGQRLLEFLRQNATPQTVFHLNLLSVDDVFMQCPEASHALYHYCDFYKYDPKDVLFKDPRVPVLHTFVIHKKTFEKMMAWLTVYMNEIESNTYPTQLSQCEFLERLHGLFINLHATRYVHMEPHLKHIWPLYHDQTNFIAYKQKV